MNVNKSKSILKKTAVSLIASLQMMNVLAVNASGGFFPTISGATTAVIEAGSSFDFEAGVKASDVEDGDLTFTVDSSAVNLSVPGVYRVVYRTVDLSNNRTTVRRTVTVVDTTAPTVMGADTTTVEAGDTFDPLTGVSAMDIVSGDLTSAIAVLGSVDTSQVGDYTLTYTATDAAGNVTTVERVVSVVDTTAPTIIGLDDVTIEAGSSFDLMSGITVTDNSTLEGTLSVEGEVDVTTVAEYMITYTAIDGSGNTTTLSRKVTVVDTTAPAVVGAIDVTVTVGSNFDFMSGVTVTDNVPRNGELIVDGSVDIYTPGTYTITYIAVDQAGNESSITRTIIVSN